MKQANGDWEFVLDSAERLSRGKIRCSIERLTSLDKRNISERKYLPRNANPFRPIDCAACWMDNRANLFSDHSISSMFCC